MKYKFKKRCPRCETKLNAELNICPNCSLNFDKFEQATNKQAKQAIKANEKHRVLMRRGCPVDVNRWKLLLITIFFGLTGAHHYYVGRYKMGVFYSIFCIVGIINAILTSVYKGSTQSDLWQLFFVLVLIWGYVIFMWIIDISNVALNRFKIPVGRE